MIIFVYDHTFEGLLTALFDAYVRGHFPTNFCMKQSLFLYFIMNFTRHHLY